MSERDIKYQERYDPLSSSYILENTLEEETINELEKEALNEYKRISKLVKTESIDSYIIQLHRLENEKPLQDIVERKRMEEMEKTKLWYRQRQVKETEELLARAQKRREIAREERRKIEEKEIAERKAKEEEKAKQEAEKKNLTHPLNYNLFQLFLMQLSLALPLIMMNAPFWLIIAIPILVYLPLIVKSLWLHIILYIVYDIARPILYVWGIIVTAQGNQDFFAIAFYIITALQAISIIKRLIGTICTIITLILSKD